ncbi:Predicted oxidoreductase, contains short-chain dehydrogenase (SDR) and DUF2520 domains [Thermoanaerobacter uzonensis DSM 18761]|uniref:Predicted oxidoreductase, contains short-chain dehydrogenase (SDR) and DUF2520 domains n=1 Tax=Thermoanaerobacter uzonensis DSM 18761 TaxID=1123369 RepID=A0A1M4TP14_9THEO|nr:Rossmann-like and DUF2520 domain-containing protein [Thermoanaerobacter uzonensis]SHE46242.1 Predicted oxidoreductase, contains short-chain dehydrogenase (SDR) and DUF2520 domains [Thermoanaerobacter uzonensis DSM 18761]
MKIGFVGAGIVGTSLAFLLSQNGINISGFLSRSLESAKKSAEFTQSSVFSSYEEVITNSDVIIISTNDNSIPEVVNNLSQYKEMLKEKTFAHLSGALNLEVLNPLKYENNFIMVLHPIQTCPSVSSALELLPKSYFTLEGDEKAVEIGKEIVNKISGKYIVLNNIVRPLYHAACVVASNYLVALSKFSLILLKKSGFPFENYPDALIPLMEGTLKNIKEKGTTDALTGPIARGDVNTVKLHLENIKDPSLEELYKSLGKLTLGIAYEKGSFNNEKYFELEGILNGGKSNNFHPKEI